MDLGTFIKRAREAKGMSQKEVSTESGLDNGNYSRIENGKTDPSFSTVIKIANALNIELPDLFNNGKFTTDVNSLDKSIIEKIALIELLDDKEKTAFYAVLDAFVGKKKLKDALANAIDLVH